MNLRQLFLQHVAQTSPGPMLTEISHAQGLYLHTHDGQRVMDLISGIGVSALGHCHPAVVKAVQDQAEKYMHTMVYGEFVLSPQVNLAKALSQHLPSDLDSVYFVNSGAEALEGALKLAKKCTRRYEVVACTEAYHGSTHGAMSLMNSEVFTHPFRPIVPGIRFIDFGHQDQLSQISENTAAVVMETVQAERGLYTPPEGYLRAVKDRCLEVGALLILDEVQCGFGRTGSLFAFEQFDLVPDILCLGKGMGGGMPIAAFISSKSNMDHLAGNPALGHITTFGGHPVNCAASLATLQVLLQTDLIAQATTKGKLFETLLQDHPLIKEIRRIGLWLALDLQDGELLQKVVQRAMDYGAFFDWFLFDAGSIRIAPPLIITEKQVEEACQLLRKALDDA